MTSGQIRRCECGHVAEWHYIVVADKNGHYGAPHFNWPDGAKTRCPSPQCPCTVVRRQTELVTLPVVLTMPLRAAS